MTSELETLTRELAKFKLLAQAYANSISELQQENFELKSQKLTLEIEIDELDKIIDKFHRGEVQRTTKPTPMDNDDRNHIVASMIELIEAAQETHPDDIFSDEVVDRMSVILDPWCTNEYRNYN